MNKLSVNLIVKITVISPVNLTVNVLKISEFTQLTPFVNSGEKNNICLIKTMFENSCIHAF